MNKLHLTIIFLLAGLCVSAQTVSFDFPALAEKSLTLALKNGIKSDTIYTGKLDAKGKAQIALPASFKNYAGMTSLTLENGAAVDFIINGESPLIRTTEEYPHGGNVIFDNSPENQSLQRWFMAQAIRQQKIGMLQEMERLYEKDNSFYPILTKEVKTLQAQQQAFEDTLRKSKLYAADFLQFHSFLNQDVATLVYGDSAQMAKTRAFVLDSLDVEKLYTSGMWFPVLNGLLALYDNGTPYHNDFINDMAVLLGRSKNDATYTTLAENLFAICESTGWNDLEEQLAYFLINDGRITNPSGRLQMLMNLFKLMKGSEVPALGQGELPEGKVLLVFYESGCNNCENEMMALRANYPILKEKGVEVVSVSADTDADVFRNTARVYPWEAKYCDLKGFSGEDFRNYGIIGTPTFYVINADRKVEGRYARLQDTGLLN